MQEQTPKLPPMLIKKSKSRYYIFTYFARWVPKSSDEEGNSKGDLTNTYKRIMVGRILTNQDKGPILFNEKFYKDFPEFKDYIVIRKGRGSYEVRHLESISITVKEDAELLNIYLDSGNYSINNGKLCLVNVGRAVGNYDVILASGSPRRKDFIHNLGLTFKVVKPNTDETPLPNEKPDDYVKRMAVTKAHYVAASYEGQLVLAADTIVVCDDQILGKPVDRKDAKRILSMLSGRTHEVMTAVCITKGKKESLIFESTKVTFAKLSKKLINTYVESGECDDKSGAYAVQGIGAMFIQKVEGSVSSVVGLPVCQVREALAHFGVNVKPVEY